MEIGLDFGTSNTSLGFWGAETVQLFNFDGVHASIPTMVFFPEDDSKHLIGHHAAQAYELGDDGRMMRSIKSILGTSLIDESTHLARRKISFEDVIFSFVSEVIAIFEKTYDCKIERLVQGRPVSFNDHDKDRDANAQKVLERCLKRAGIKHVRFLAEPIAAAKSIQHHFSDERLVFVVDIGGGTSDFSLVRIARKDKKFDVLGTSGVYLGGNDLDRELSYNELCSLFGKGETLSKNGLPAPNFLFSILSDWKSLNKIYTRQSQSQMAWMQANSPQSLGFKALHHLISHHNAHRYARDTEALKIALSQNDEAIFVYNMDTRILERPVARSSFETLINAILVKMDAAIHDCLASAAINPDAVSDVLLVGGSTLIPRIERYLTRRFGSASVIANDRFGAVAKGLAVEARANL